MDTEALQLFIYSHIPVVQRNGFFVGRVDHLQAEIHGLYKEHTNHRNTVFGGSISTALTLAAWSQLRLIMEIYGIEAGTVVRRQSVEFNKPVDGDFYAVARSMEPETLVSDIERFHRLGKSRIKITADLFIKGQSESCAEFYGEFALLS